MSDCPLIRRPAASLQTLTPTRSVKSRPDWRLLFRRFVYRAMLRPPLTEIPVRSRQPHGDTFKTTNPLKHPKRVCFDVDGIISLNSTDVAALSLARKHEESPSTLKMSRYRETLEVGSASSWNKITLTNFGADFNKQEHTPLNTIISDPKFYDKNEKVIGFISRTSPTPFPSFVQY